MNDVEIVYSHEICMRDGTKKLHERFLRNGKPFNRFGGPTLILYAYDGSVEAEYFNHENNSDEPFAILYYPCGYVSHMMYGTQNCFHRENGKPAIIHYNKDGTVMLEKFFELGIEINKDK